MPAAPKSFAKGSYLFKEGETSKSLYIIIKGTVNIRKTKGTGFIELGNVYANEVLGELSFFDKKPRSASAYATSEVEVHEIEFHALEKIFQVTPPYVKTIISAIVERLRKADDKIRSLQKDFMTDTVDEVDPSGDGKTTEALQSLEEPKPKKF